MPKDQTAYGVVTFNNVTITSGTALFASNPFPYTTTTYNLTSSDIIDLNNRGFIVHSLVLVFTRTGNMAFFSVIYDLEGTAGSGNKYEITIPSLTSIPSMLVGECIALESGSTFYETRQAFVYGGTKIRIMNNNSLNTGNSTSDFSFAYSKRFTGRINFRYTI
jgi:hypothetical protein